MIPANKRIAELTWCEIITDLDERYRENIALHSMRANPAEREFINVKECAAITGYTLGYIRQLVFKRAIPFHKNPRLKPVRFRKSEILEWMAAKKFVPTEALAENYIMENQLIKNNK